MDAFVSESGLQPDSEGQIAETPRRPVQELVNEFHELGSLPWRATPRLPSDPAEMRLYLSLLSEETEEFSIAIDHNDLIGLADALADIVYVAYGAALQLGVDLDAVLAEVHRANMSKVVNGNRMRRSDGKVMRGSEYRPPDVREVLRRMGMDLDS